MTPVIAIGLLLAWWFVVGVAKELYLEAEHRRADRVMEAYLRAEDARAHRWVLEDIERRRHAASEEMIRAAQAVSSGQIIEGTAVEIGRR